MDRTGCLISDLPFSLFSLLSRLHTSFPCCPRLHLLHSSRFTHSRCARLFSDADGTQQGPGYLRPVKPLLICSCFFPHIRRELPFFPIYLDLLLRVRGLRNARNCEPLVSMTINDTSRYGTHYMEQSHPHMSRAVRGNHITRTAHLFAI